MKQQPKKRYLLIERNEKEIHKDAKRASLLCLMFIFSFVGLCLTIYAFDLLICNIFHINRDLVFSDASIFLSVSILSTIWLALVLILLYYAEYYIFYEEFKYKKKEIKNGRKK